MCKGPPARLPLGAPADACIHSAHHAGSRICGPWPAFGLRMPLSHETTTLQSQHLELPKCWAFHNKCSIGTPTLKPPQTPIRNSPTHLPTAIFTSSPPACMHHQRRAMQAQCSGHSSHLHEASVLCAPSKGICSPSAKPTLAQAQACAAAKTLMPSPLPQQPPPRACKWLPRQRQQGRAHPHCHHATHNLCTQLLAHRRRQPMLRPRSQAGPHSMRCRP